MSPARLRAADLAELVRLPATLTVPGDAWAGAASAAQAASAVGATPRGGWTMPLASACIYTSGMAFNDWCDRAVDAEERPERPIPSGRVAPGVAVGLAGGLLAAGIGVSALAGGPRALRVSLPLAAAAWGYDALAKDTAVGPLVMASARALDVVLGAHGSPVDAWRPAVAVGAHTAAVTTLSRGEVHGTRPATAYAALGTTLVVAAATAADAWRESGAGALRGSGARGRDRVAATALAASYAVSVGRAQAAAARRPDAATTRRATGTGIAGLTLLQAAWLARRGRLVAAAGVAGALPAMRAATRRMSAT